MQALNILRNYKSERITRALAFGITVIFLMVPRGIFAQPAEEHQIKAVFIFNFTQFIQWPETSFSHSTSPFIIGVLGEDLFDNVLEETVRNEKINGHPIQVKYLARLEDLNDCHILYIGRDEKDISGITNRINRRAVLTISDYPDFMEASGCIRFYTENNKIRLEINETKATENGLKISSKLLRLAKLYSKR